MGGLKQPLLNIWHLSILMTYISQHAGVSWSHPQDVQGQRTLTRHVLTATLSVNYRKLKQQFKVEGNILEVYQFSFSMLKV